MDLHLEEGDEEGDGEKGRGRTRGGGGEEKKVGESVGGEQREVRLLT